MREYECGETLWCGSGVAVVVVACGFPLGLLVEVPVSVRVGDRSEAVIDERCRVASGTQSVVEELGGRDEVCGVGAEHGEACQLSFDEGTEDFSAVQALEGNVLVAVEELLMLSLIHI